MVNTQILLFYINILKEAHIQPELGYFELFWGIKN